VTDPNDPTTYKKNDAQTQDVREGNKAPTEADIENAPTTDDEQADDEADAKQAKASAKKAKATATASVPESKGEGLKAKLAHLAGVKVSDVMGFHAENQVITTWQGGKYRLAADGKSLIHLSGPTPEANKEAAGK
jgi:hypothetical protein